MYHGMHYLQDGGQRTTCRWISLFVWCILSNDIPRQYTCIAICIVIRLSCYITAFAVIVTSLKFYSTALRFE
jgi:hypothetical protein